jgi:hypothetical protein
VYNNDFDNCTSRFDVLLALDHSRAEPWGSRHALAFSAFALQHARRYSPQVSERAWILLYKVYKEGEDHKRVADAFKRLGNQSCTWAVPPLPAGTPARCDVTIASLGTFEAETYPQQLDRWCKAALAGWLNLVRHQE